MFSLLVALWFAALFGLASVAIRPAVLEQLVLDLGIDTLIPAASPPLGTTFRALLASSLGAIGAVIGAVVAGRLRGRRHVKAGPVEPRRARDAHPDAPPRRPIFAHEELGEEEDRHRPLTFADDAARDLSEPDTDLLDEPTAYAFSPPQDDPREDSADLATPLAEPEDDTTPEPQPLDQPIATSLFIAAAEAELEASDASASAARRLVGKPLTQLSIAELSERLAIALENRRLRHGVAHSITEHGEPAASSMSESPAASPPLEQPADEGPDPEALAGGYSSLLNLSRPASLRNEPVATFPSQADRRTAAADPSPASAARLDQAPSSVTQLDGDETNQALRAALATLQRMSGAA